MVYTLTQLVDAILVKNPLAESSEENVLHLILLYKTSKLDYLQL